MMKKNLIESWLSSNEITLVCTFSRPNMVKPFFEALDEMLLPRDKIDLLIFDNTENITLHPLLEAQAKRLEPYFKSVRLYTSGRVGGCTLLGQSNDKFNKSKLRPIWDMWVDLCKLIKTDVFFMLEDDTIAPPHAFYTLLCDFLTCKNAGFITGIETGRVLFEWMPVRLGVHYLTRRKNKILRRLSLKPTERGIKEIDCSGVYCFICFTKLWKKAVENQKGYILECPFFGMDNLLTNNIKKLGYKLYADFRVWCDHLHQAHGSLIKFNKRNAVQMLDIWLPEANNYAQCIEIKK